MAASLAGLSASVTRILYLTGFPKELKTKDIQTAFSEWEAVSGGFKIKWRDDTSLLIVFQDASVAKRAYLHTIAFPPPVLTSQSGVAATIRPYDGPDAQNVIQTVNSRGQHNANPSRAQNGRSNSISVFPAGVSPISTRPSSGSISRGGPQYVNIPAPDHHHHQNGREPSPTLPSLPSHPTLNSLINSSLGDVAEGSPPSDPAILATSMHPDMLAGSGPRIGNPGKRMLGAALGVRHPALGPRVISGGSPGTSPSQGGGVDQAMREVQRAMNGLVVAE
ncbi:hypothetical protein FB45DRAFT_328465 [Roridomyces roridus]|jgi:hypothetical protein|uniref:Uncharacterized protein n=1 Tax=Roridomyces roridus TaxID=1738132 RepID=A0AAD7B5S4_9AGAR|nr:hypothetical protein FB45DRAFT_328465 [Roridomyces roridus]